MFPLPYTILTALQQERELDLERIARGKPKAASSRARQAPAHFTMPRTEWLPRLIRSVRPRSAKPSNASPRG
jgi:hypothetical protein